jgi:hypothetical protein
MAVKMVAPRVAAVKVEAKEDVVRVAAMEVAASEVATEEGATVTAPEEMGWAVEVRVKEEGSAEAAAARAMEARAAYLLLCSSPCSRTPR